MCAVVLAADLKDVDAGPFASSSLEVGSAGKIDSSFAFIAKEYDALKNFRRDPSVRADILPNQERTLVAQSALATDTVVLEIPKSLVITRERVVKLHPEFRGIVDENGLGLDNLMAIFIARVRSAQDNDYEDRKGVFKAAEYTFLHQLPGGCRNAFYFSGDVFDVLPPWLTVRAKNTNLSLSTYWTVNAGHPPNDRPFGISFDQFKEALCLFLARGVEIERGERAMVPFVNYIRYVSDNTKANIAWKFDAATKAWRVVTLRPVGAGEELLLLSSSYPAAHQITSFGTYERPVINSNSVPPFVPELVVDAPKVEETDPLKEEKKEALKLLNSRYFALGWKLNQSAGFPPEVIRLFRVLLMNETDYAQFVSGTDAADTTTIRGRIARYVREGVNRPDPSLSLHNEEKLFAHLFNFCNSSMLQIPDGNQVLLTRTCDLLYSLFIQQMPCFGQPLSPTRLFSRMSFAWSKIIASYSRVARPSSADPEDVPRP